MSFDRDRFNTFLSSGDEPLPALWFHYDEGCPSTNAQLWQFIDRGVPLPAVALAKQQSAGRGQWGRTWQSPPGGLYLSVAIAPHLPAAESFPLIACSALGIAEQLRQWAVPVQLKWPNDLILNGRKLGGIKIETRLRKGQIALAVIGVGINWRNPVPAPGTNLQDFPALSSLELLAAIATRGSLEGYRRYCCEGISPLLTRYNRLLDSIGREVIVDGCPAVVIAVEASGSLHLRQQTPEAAEIFRKPGTISLGYDDTGREDPRD